MVERECELARNFTPVLKRFILWATSPRDGTLQEAVRELQTNYPFAVDVWFWGDMNSYLNRMAPLALRYARQILAESSADTAKENADWLRTAIDRPAFTTPGNSERNLEDQLKAVGDTLRFIKTGVLRDRENNLIFGLLPEVLFDAEDRLPRLKLVKALEAFKRAIERRVAAAAKPSSQGTYMAYLAVETTRVNVVQTANLLFGKYSLPEIDLP